ncbi:MAG: RIP metalloprotease RseP [Gammaproteobacteria bacterium]|nr:RIP metalloprotease RseP [Gammaproteobacteria bacterium]
MSGVGLSLLWFLVAIGVLVTIHEFGHFWVARRLGVKVLRFSIGFGRPLWTRRFGRDDTEFVIAAVPLGGYVKMLDEREAPVPPRDLERAFNRKPVGTRMAVVVAGPLFNFLFAIVAYWLMFVTGVPGIKPVVGAIEPASYAANAGFHEGDEILAIDDRPVASWDMALVELLEAALDRRESEVDVDSPERGRRLLVLDLRDAPEILDKGGVLQNLGLSPWVVQLAPVIERTLEGGAAAAAGLQPGDRILSADGQTIEHWSEWVSYVRERPGQAIALRVERGDTELAMRLVPEAVEEEGATFGRIGAYVQVPEGGHPLRTLVRHGPLESIPQALDKTWSMTTLTLRTLWAMLTGRASVENISGPISIAQYAGISATIGMAYFLGFLAVVSISLGILNLLPIPILDGGHLMYYCIELFKGSPVSEATQALGQQVGIFLLLALMVLAFYNDLVRLLG